MIAIQKNNTLLASIDLFSTAPAEQQALIEKLSNRVQSIVRSQLECASGSVNRSLDRERVMCYLQRFAPVRDYWRGLAENEFHVYEVVSVFERS
jgi:hypothetical protein